MVKVKYSALNRMVWLATLLFTITACAVTPSLPTPPSLLPTPIPPLTIIIPPIERPPQPTSTRVLVTPTPSSPQFDAAKLKVDLDVLMASFMSEQNVVGCSVAVVYPDVASDKLQKQYFNYGTLSRDSKTPVSLTTIYEIGSLTKLFTADLLALYVRDGRMKLDDPLLKYLPGNVHVPTFNGQVTTLMDLATHTSGLPRDVPRTRNVGGVAVEVISEDEIFKFINGYQLTRAPGSQWEYSNLAFDLLGIAEEKLSSTSYENLVMANIAARLGMNDTRITLSPIERARLAQGYAANGNQAPSVAGTMGAGALRSTIQDMATYLAANITPDNTPLGLAIQETQQRHAIGPNPSIVTGLGWQINNAGTAHELFNKLGATAGYNAVIAFSRKSRSGFVAACDGQNIRKLVPRLLDFVGEVGTQLDENE